MELKSLANDPQTVIVYDNINFRDTKRDETLGHAATMRSMTTAAIIKCPELPETGLTQSMQDPSVELKVEDIFNSPALCGNDADRNIGPEITRYLISDAIRRVHNRGVDHVFRDVSPPQMPILDRIKPAKTKFWQFGAIPEDEGSIAGTYAVDDNIFLRQLGFYAPEVPTDQESDVFNRRLWLVHGDQQTGAEAVRPTELAPWHSFMVPHPNASAQYHRAYTLGACG